MVFHPEVTSFNVSDLAWPSSVDRDAFFSAMLAYAFLSANELDADPFDQYANWTDLAWGEAHWISRSDNRTYDLELP